jgi:hypothetical protein
MTITKPDTGTCLICRTTQSLAPGGPISGPIAGHWTVAEDQGTGEPTKALDPTSGGLVTSWTCQGSFHVPERRDGRDSTRREAIGIYWRVRNEADAARVRMDSDATGPARWQVRDVVSFYSVDIVRNEELARMWRAFAIHGDWTEALKDALGVLSGYTSGTRHVDNALAEMKRDAARDFLRTARQRLQRWVMGPPGDGLAPLPVVEVAELLGTILFDI